MTDCIGRPGRFLDQFLNPVRELASTIFFDRLKTENRQNDGDGCRCQSEGPFARYSPTPVLPLSRAKCLDSAD